MNNGLSMLNVLNGLSRTLSVARQIIPLYKQIKPIVANSGKLLDNFKSIGMKNSNNKSVSNSNVNNIFNEDKNQRYNVSYPTFFQ
ncbi:MAG TPA: hypothetical protein DCE23_00385 [Firmicutes bacterium]|nr:hypothetical protein [Bacillota bacterium]